ncbi:hypothetical protein EVAR_81913_1 [Eumeta japonica]|uniref:Secreted protein n=1 Tax=Eumeta variegata TaxID=151549 RepID=A0A4C1UWY2_EUMVA|nr:hypothetical protein EVAR_81913_1 [Eumeta japonica]
MTAPIRDLSLILLIASFRFLCEIGGGTVLQRPTTAGQELRRRRRYPGELRARRGLRRLVKRLLLTLLPFHRAGRRTRPVPRLRCTSEPSHRSPP